MRKLWVSARLKHLRLESKKGSKLGLKKTGGCWHLLENSKGDQLPSFELLFPTPSQYVGSTTDICNVCHHHHNNIIHFQP